MKLKIGILGSRGIPNAYGGFEEFAEHLSPGLANKGHEVYVYNSSLHPFREKTWKGVNIVQCKDPENRLEAAGQFVYDLNCILDARKRDYDILLQLGYTSNSIWHRLWPKKAVNIVNMDGLEWKRTQYTKPVRRFIKKAEAWAARYADYMVADSPAIQQHILTTYNRRSYFIPYAAEVFTQPDATLLNKIQLQPYQYYLAVSRLEPENNIEMIIKGYLASGQDYNLVVVGKVNKLGERLRSIYNSERIKFTGAIYDKPLLNNLRYFSKLYFHGHSVGGTNPSLLEAMACQCNIAAHDNIFNRVVLGREAEFFSDHESVLSILHSQKDVLISSKRKQKNLEKILETYHWSGIVDAYEKLMMEAILAKKKQVGASVRYQTA